MEETVSSLLSSKKLKKNVEFSALYFHAEHRWDPSGFTSRTFDFAYPDATTDEVVLEWIDPFLENLTPLIRWNDFLVEKLTFLQNFLEINGKELEEVISGSHEII